MGRLAKNRVIKTGSYAIRMPMGSNTVGPQRPQAGQVRFNKSNNNLEVFYSGEWRHLGTTGRVAIVKDTFIGDGVTADFTMLNAPTGEEQYYPGMESDVLVFVGGVFQEPNVAYTLNNAVISFTGVPDLGMPVVVLHNFNSTHVR